MDFPVFLTSNGAVWYFFRELRGEAVIVHLAGMSTSTLKTFINMHKRFVN